MVRPSLSLLGAAALQIATVAAKCCTNLTIPVTVSARNGKFNLAPPENSIDVANFALKLGRRGANYTQEVLEEAGPPALCYYSTLACAMLLLSRVLTFSAENTDLHCQRNIQHRCDILLAVCRHPP